MNDRILSRSILELAFERMGQKLSRKNVFGEIAIYEGTVIMRQLDDQGSSSDINCFGKNKSRLIIDVAREVGCSLGIGRDWLNEQASIYGNPEVGERGHIPFGSYPRRSAPHLKVISTSLEYLDSMKAEALTGPPPLKSCAPTLPLSK